MLDISNNPTSVSNRVLCTVQRSIPIEHSNDIEKLNIYICNDDVEIADKINGAKVIHGDEFMIVYTGTITVRNADFICIKWENGLTGAYKYIK